MSLKAEKAVLKLLRQRAGLIAGMVLAIALTAGAVIFSTEQVEHPAALVVSADQLHVAN